MIVLDCTLLQAQENLLTKKKPHLRLTDLQILGLRRVTNVYLHFVSRYRKYLIVHWLVIGATECHLKLNMTVELKAECECSVAYPFKLY